ncbi:MAG: ABC transporter permease [Thermoanaerobaculia bacterium]|nr:ABC transporter permease [Thermoanaerobaculia bacterium]
MSASARQMVRFRGLLATLVSRDLKARYRGSALGFAWSLLNPLLLLGVYSFVFGYVFVQGRAELVDPYALFLITGLFPWVWVSTSLLEGTVSLSANAGLIRKAVFPIELLPMVPVVANLIHFLLAVPVIAGALLIGRYLGKSVGGVEAVLLPAVILLQLPMIAGMTLALAALNVHFKDVRDLLANLLQLLFFMTPILYPLEWVSFPVLQAGIRWANPFSPFTLAYQELLFRGAVPEPSLWIEMAVWSLAAWSAGAWLFGRLRNSLVEAV